MLLGMIIIIRGLAAGSGLCRDSGGRLACSLHLDLIDFRVYKAIGFYEVDSWCLRGCVSRVNSKGAHVLRDDEMELTFFVWTTEGKYVLMERHIYKKTKRK